MQAIMVRVKVVSSRHEMIGSVEGALNQHASFTLHTLNSIEKMTSHSKILFVHPHFIQQSYESCGYRMKV